MSYSGFNGGLATVRTAVSTSAPTHGGSGKRAHQRELELKVAALQKDYAELHTELVEAAQVHRRLCAPRLVRYHNFEIASETFAVRHVPGDFFTIEETGRGIILALSDICGKGLAAGMWTTYLAGLVANHTATTAEPEAIVSGVNCDLCRMSPVAPLASLFLARLDPFTGRLDYCSAGHPPALLLRADGRLESQSEGGPLLGVIPGATFVRGSFELRAGDLLLICSDGILESRNNIDQEFGYERLEAEFRNARANAAAAVLFSVLGAVQDFAAGGPLVDDMSLVIVSRRAQ
ncbi:MAG TPA: PP2C family protein-serine/threonine phosphatase [Pyrinomonadaceae bacterium]|jgi:sigma-B regulation protein RsbU (phosphoserine phosphatase)